MLFFLRCFFRLEWGDGGGSSLGLELSTSAGPLAGEGRVGEVWAAGRVGTGHQSCLVPLGHPGRARLTPSPGEAYPASPNPKASPASVEKVGRGECRKIRQRRIKARRKGCLLQPGGVEGGPGNSQGAEAPASPHQIYPQSHSPLLTINSRIRNNQGAA